MNILLSKGSLLGETLLSIVGDDARIVELAAFVTIKGAGRLDFMYEFWRYDTNFFYIKNNCRTEMLATYIIFLRISASFLC